MPYNNLVQSVLRGMDIILEIGKSDKAMTLRELAKNLNLKTPTTHNLVRTLKSKGFIQQQPGACYILGPTLFELTSQHQESRLIAEAGKAVRSLFAGMNQKATITFTEVIGGEIQTRLRMSPDQPAIMQKPRRQTLNPYASATAIIFHAFASEEEKNALQERYPFQEYAGQLASDPNQYQELVKQARKQGYAFPPVCDPNRFAVAAPVLGKTDELMAIIGLSLFNPDGEQIEKTDKNMAIGKLLTAALNISKVWISLTENRPARTENKPI